MVIKEVDSKKAELSKRDFENLIRDNGSLEVIIVGVSDLKESKFGEGNYIFVDFQISEPIQYNGEDLKGCKVGISYPLQYNKYLENSEDGTFYISPKSKLYPLLKYGLEADNQRINKAITCELSDIEFFLLDLQLTVYVDNTLNYPVIAPVRE